MTKLIRATQSNFLDIRPAIEKKYHNSYLFSFIISVILFATFRLPLVRSIFLNYILNN